MASIVRKTGSTEAKSGPEFARPQFQCIYIVISGATSSVTMNLQAVYFLQQ